MLPSDMNDILKAKQGDTHALASLFRRHAALVQKLAVRFAEREDAFQAGCMGLVKAIRGYRAEMGFAFSTYAVPVILGEMRCVRNEQYGWRTEMQIRRMNRYREQMMKEKGRDATASELEKLLCMDRADITLLMEVSKGVLYFEEEHFPAQAIADPGSEAWLQRFFIRDILQRMPMEYSYILRRRYVFHESQLTLSERLNMHQSSISRTEKKARLMFQSAWLEG